MPNWVYTLIKTPSTNEELVKKIIDAGGICDYYMPMPEEIKNTNSPNKIITEEEYAIKQALNQTSEENGPMIAHYQTQKMVDELKAKYNAENWYDWALLYWGTKWGDRSMQYQNDGDELVIQYESAWSPVGADIMENFLRELKDADYIWEEEQGYGGQHIVEDGELVHSIEWDIPSFKYWAYLDSDTPSLDLDGKPRENKYVQIPYAYLSERYENNMGIYEPGWHDYSEWYGESSLVTDSELIKKLESLKK